MGCALLPVSFVRLHVQSIRRSCFRLSAASVTLRSPAHQPSTGRSFASHHRDQGIAARGKASQPYLDAQCQLLIASCTAPVVNRVSLRIGSAAFCRSFGSVRSHLQSATRPHAGNRVQGMRTAVVSAHSSAPMQRKVSHILVRADQPEILDEVEERLAGKKTLPRCQARAHGNA